MIDEAASAFLPPVMPIKAPNAMPPTMSVVTVNEIGRPIFSTDLTCVNTYLLFFAAKKLKLAKFTILVLGRLERLMI